MAILKADKLARRAAAVIAVPGFIQNLLWLGSTTGVGMLANFVYGIQVARHLGPVEFGRFAIVLAVGGWLVSFTQGSGATALTVLSAQRRDAVGPLFLAGTGLQFIVGALGLALSIVMVQFMTHDHGLLLPSSLYAAGGVAVLMTTVPLAIFRGYNRMAWNSAMALQGVLSVLFVGFIVHAKLGLLAAVGAWTAASVIVALGTLAVAVCTISRKSLYWDASTSQSVWKVSSGLWGVTLFQTLHWRISVLVVQQCASAHELGIYSGANRLIEYMRAIPWILLLAALPAFARAAGSSLSELRQLINRCMRFVVPVAMMLALVLIVGANRIVIKLLSAKFAGSGPVFAIAVVATIFVFIHWVLLQALLSAKMNRQLILTYLAGAGAQVLTGVVLVPRMGATGGAWSYVAGEFTAMLLSGVFAWRCLEWRPSRRMILLSCCSAALVSAALLGAGHIGGSGREQIHMAGSSQAVVSAHAESLH